MSDFRLLPWYLVDRYFNWLLMITVAATVLGFLRLFKKKHTRYRRYWIYAILPMVAPSWVSLHMHESSVAIQTTVINFSNIANLYAASLFIIYAPVIAWKIPLASASTVKLIFMQIRKRANPFAGVCLKPGDRIQWRGPYGERTGHVIQSTATQKDHIQVMIDGENTSALIKSSEVVTTKRILTKSDDPMRLLEVLADTWAKKNGPIMDSIKNIMACGALCAISGYMIRSPESILGWSAYLRYIVAILWGVISGIMIHVNAGKLAEELLPSGATYKYTSKLLYGIIYLSAVIITSSVVKN